MAADRSVASDELRVLADDYNLQRWLEREEVFRLRDERHATLPP